MCALWFPVVNINRRARFELWLNYKFRFYQLQSVTVASVAAALAHISNDSIFDNRVSRMENVYAATLDVMIDCVIFTPSNKFHFAIGNEAEP